MKKVHKGLVFAFGPVKDGRREFVVSADGIRNNFPAVEKLVAAAPEIRGWKIIAFRPAVGTDISMQIGDMEFGADDIWFAAEPHNGIVGLTLYVRDLSEANKEILLRGAFLLLDAALGEYAVETKMGYIQFEPLPFDPVASRLKPFRDLPETVEKMSGK